MALKHDYIRVFLKVEEVALALSCLNWVKTELRMANDDLPKLNTPEGEAIRSGIPTQAFTVLLPVLDATVRSIIEESLAHFDETGNERGIAHFQQKLQEWEKTTLAIQQFRELVSFASRLPTKSHQIQED